jgi:nitrogen-specific signal transduction histidine kinase
MIDASVMAAILDSLKDPVMFADTEHAILYMNKAAVAHFDDGEALLGTSLLDCHNERSCEIILETLEAMHKGEDERLITDTEKHRIYMRAVRDTAGEVIGYYERYAPPAGQPGE